MYVTGNSWERRPVLTFTLPANNPLAQFFPTSPVAAENQSTTPAAPPATAAAEQASAPTAEEDEDEVMASMLQTVTSQIKARRAISGDNAHIPRPGTSYPRYRMESDLHETAKLFYETAAKAVGVSLPTLVRAVFQAETKISRYLEDQRRIDFYGGAPETDLNEDDSSDAPGADDYSMAD